MKDNLPNYQTGVWRIALRFISQSAPAVLGLLLCAAGPGGCATVNEHSTESFLAAAGFQKRTPSTPKQKEIYAQMKPYKLQTGMFNGKTLYAYKDEKQGVIYFGNEQQYQKYRQLIAQGISEAEQMNEAWQMNPDSWGLNF